MLASVKRDYIKWFEFNIGVVAENQSTLSSFLRFNSSFLTGNQIDDYLLEQQNMHIQSARFQAEKEDVEATN